MDTKYKGDLILLRGIPGSGKSTLGNVILKCIESDRPYVLSTDDYFYDEKGNYNFDASKLKIAHNECQEKCAKRMKLEFVKIVVANTFTQEWEMKPYFEMAERYGYRVHSVIIENRHDGENIHNVPDEKIKQMTDRFEIKL
jgi:tRNA uridine 5-carbamoylmethylation protein Kti12